LTDDDAARSLPDLHAERIDIEGERYLIYYTFETEPDEPEPAIIQEP
jgi:hypothetical protein